MCGAEYNCGAEEKLGPDCRATAKGIPIIPPKKPVRVRSSCKRDLPYLRYASEAILVTRNCKSNLACIFVFFFLVANRR